MAGFDNDTMYADNYDFRGVSPVEPQVTVEGQLPIGTGGSPAIEVGLITSPLGTIDIGYSNPNITIDLMGGGIGIQEFNVDVGANVVPTVGGIVTVTGTHVFSSGSVANTLTLDVDASAYTFLLGAGNNTPVTELGPLTNGQLIIGSTGVSPVAGSLASADGSITITPGAGTIDLSVSASDDAILTLTGDDATARSPTLGNIDILGLSGSKTSSDTSTIIVKSPPYQDEAAGTTVTLNSGSFATNAITLTLPLSAGLSDGDLVEFVATNGVLTIQLSGTQVGHLGADSTSAGGTFTGSATGDSLSLRYQSSTDDWWATSSVGVWVLA